MSTIILGKGSKSFLNSIKFKALHKAIVIDLQVRTLSLYTKILPKNQIGVFGDYDVFIFYKDFSNKNRGSYEVMSIRNTLCEIIPYENLSTKDQINSQDIQISAIFTAQPTCKFSIENSKKSNHHKSFWKIEVSGEIQVTLTSNETSVVEETLQIEETNKIENIPHKKAIQVPVVLGQGSTQIFATKKITILPPSAPIWYIKDIQKKVIINDQKVIPNKVIINGFIIKNIYYETIEDVQDETISSGIYHITTKIPFDGVINIVPNPNEKIKEGDICEVLEAYVAGDNDELLDPIKTKCGEVVYQKILEKMVVKITVKITRNETINIWVDK